MKVYHILIFDSGHVNATYVITARDDEDATEQTKKKFTGNDDVQIWEQRRFVARLMPRD